MADKLTVLLVDDHALVRKGFRRMLEDDPAIAVVGEASEGGITANAGGAGGGREEEEDVLLDS